MTPKKRSARPTGAQRKRMTELRQKHAIGLKIRGRVGFLPETKSRSLFDQYAKENLLLNQWIKENNMGRIGQTLGLFCARKAASYAMMALADIPKEKRNEIYEIAGTLRAVGPNSIAFPTESAKRLSHLLGTPQRMNEFDTVFSDNFVSMYAALTNKFIERRALLNQNAQS
jgi:hypothetical protein